MSGARAITRVGSGGPRTAEGKARACRNALKHGLAGCYKHDLLLLQQTRQMALAICGNESDNELLFEQALLIAEYDRVLRRIKAQRVTIIERLRDPLTMPITKDDIKRRLKIVKLIGKQRDLAYSEFSQLQTKLVKQGQKVVCVMRGRRTKANKNWKYEPLKDRDEFNSMREAIGDLERLRRYEKRAWSRRNRAIREFITIQAMPPVATSDNTVDQITK
jgi:hypothetical protein